MIALTVLSIGTAKPSAAVQVPRDRATVMLAIDVSLSMEATDVLPTRLKAAQAAAKQFADKLPKRINLGLVDFARAGNVLVPPTLNRGSVKTRDRRSAPAELHRDRRRASSPRSAPSRTSRRTTTAHGDKPPPARIVLLSDGSNTHGRSISSADQAAKKAHVTVSTIAFGTPTGTVTTDGQTCRCRPIGSNCTRSPPRPAGSYHSAASEQELKSVYADIGSQIGYTTEHRDISYRWLLAGVLTLFVAGAAGLLWSGRLV